MLRVSAERHATDRTGINSTVARMRVNRLTAPPTGTNTTLTDPPPLKHQPANTLYAHAFYTASPP
jgi:hypothetical protein